VNASDSHRVSSNPGSSREVVATAELFLGLLASLAVLLPDVDMATMPCARLVPPVERGNAAAGWTLPKPCLSKTPPDALSLCLDSSFPVPIRGGVSESTACMRLDMLAMADFLSAAVVFPVSLRSRVGMMTVPFPFKSKLCGFGCDEVTNLRDVVFDLCR